MLGCSSVRVVSEKDLNFLSNCKYMGSKDGFHHLTIPEKTTVFYEHVKIPIQDYIIDNEMPYTNDKTKWREITIKNIKLEESN